MPKMEGAMRATHVKLDPIDTNSTSFVNATGPPGMVSVSNANSISTQDHPQSTKGLNASVQFNKGMLSPIDPNRLPSNVHTQGMNQHSPQGMMKKQIKNSMNTSMYRNQNQGVSASQNPAPRRNKQNE